MGGKSYRANTGVVFVSVHHLYGLFQIACFKYTMMNLMLSKFCFCDAPLSSGLENASFLNNLGFQEPASPLMEGIIALHSDIWAIMLFVAGFVLYMMCATLLSSPEKSYKVHHHNLIEIVWTTLPAIILCVIAIPSFTLLYSLDEIVQPCLTVKAIGRQWYWCAPSNADSDWT